MQIEQVTPRRTPTGLPLGALGQPAEGQVLLRVQALSLDPYLRSAMAGLNQGKAVVALCSRHRPDHCQERFIMLPQLTLAAAVLVMALGTARAEPVPAAERLPVDIRRTTFVVRDIDKSLPLYRDALGLKLIYDTPIGGGVDKDGRAIAPTVRLVLLRANDTFIGALGLMQRLGTPAAAVIPPPEFKKAGLGQMIMVINIADLEERWPKIAATPHIKVETAPTRIDYPNPAGGVIPVLFSAVWDADGNYIELNKILGAPAGTPAK